MSKKEGSSGKWYIQFMLNVGIPKLLTYQKIIEEMNGINIGKLHDVRKELCDELEGDEKINGKYRNLLELLLRLHSFIFL